MDSAADYTCSVKGQPVATVWAGICTVKQKSKTWGDVGHTVCLLCTVKGSMVTFGVAVETGPKSLQIDNGGFVRLLHSSALS